MEAETSSLGPITTAELGNGPCIAFLCNSPHQEQLLRIVQVLHSFPSFLSPSALLISK